MKPLFISMLILVAGYPAARARTWTNTQGKTLEAEVVKINPDRTVVLKTARGKTATLPFDTFIESDVGYLERLLIRHERGDLHPVPWEKMNELFGLEIWQDAYLWDDATSAAAERMKMKKESQTAFMENHRAYPLGRTRILDEPVYATALYGGEAHVESLSMVFLNRGDIPRHQETRISPPSAEEIEASGTHVYERIFPVLGEPERDSLGRDDLREKVWRWDWNNHAIMLSLQEGKYAALRIMPTDRADRGGRIDKLSDDELKQRVIACVERRKNGDIIIGNIPMINQGPKGYCSPATWERYLRYLDIPADMYLLALAAGTGAGGGTYSHAIVEATSNIVSSNGRKLKEIASKPTVKLVSRYIDQGLPIMWSLRSTPDFQLAASNNTAVRNGKPARKSNRSGQSEDTSAGGHICLIVGYNPQTSEIAISDSWGPKFTERWVPLDRIQAASMGSMYVIRW